MHTGQESGKEDQMKTILRVSGQMEISPSGRYQLRDRRIYPKAWTDCAGAHGQEPMKFFKPGNMMQEHHQSNEPTHQAGDSWTSQHQISF
jgi:hypothetical protein